MPKYFTPEGLDKLKKELNYLKTVKRREIAERLKHTAAFGDLTENFAYQQTKEDQAFLEGRILELEKIICQAEVVEKKKETKEVQIGSIVTVSSGDIKEKFQIVGLEETDPKKRKISYQSPLGEALFGKTIGERIEIKTLEGKIKKYKILKIE